MAWRPGESGNPRGRPPGPRAPQLRGGSLVLRDYLERQLSEHRDVVDQTLLRILKSPRQLPKLLTLYAKVNLEVAPPALLVEVALEAQSRTQWLAERSEQQARLTAERVAQLAAATGPVYTFVNPPAPVAATPSPAVDVPMALQAPASAPPGQSESPSSGTPMNVPPAQPSPPRMHPVPPLPRAREELAALRQARHNGGV